MTRSGIGGFILGGILGSVIGYFTARKVLEKEYFNKYADKAEELQTYYENMYNYARDDDTDDLMGEKENVRAAEEPNQPIDIQAKTSYKDIYQGKKELVRPDPAEEEHPEEDEEENEDDENEADPEEIEAFEEHLKNVNRPPCVVDWDKTSDVWFGWDMNTLYYYAFDGTLTTEDDGVIDDGDTARLVGDCLETSEFIENDEKELFVANYQLNTIYDIVKVWGVFRGE